MKVQRKGRNSSRKRRALKTRFRNIKKANNNLEEKRPVIIVNRTNQHISAEPFHTAAAYIQGSLHVALFSGNIY